MNMQMVEHPQVTLNGASYNSTPGLRPVRVDGCDTIVKLFALRCAKLGGRTAHREKDMGIWKAYSWSDYWAQAKWLGLGLRALGLQRGEVVSILSEDRKEWLYADMGIQGVGGIAAGVYTTDSASQLAYILNDSGSRFLIVEDDEQLDKYLEIQDQVPELEKVVILEREGLHDLDHDRCLFIDDLFALGRKYEADNPDCFEDEILKSQAGETALLVYTSGTTGRPKGAMLAHENILGTMESGARALATMPSDEQLCFLPLCHILERNVSVYLPLAAGSTVNFAESPETVFDNMREVSPSTFFAVPRVWEKIYSQVLVMAQEATPLGRWAFTCAIRAGTARATYLMQNQPVPGLVAARYALWDFAVLRNLRRMLGMDKMRRGGSGAAPISPELLKWYWSIGVRLLEGYGMTENAGLTAANTIEANRVGTVGLPVPGITVRIADSGEIQTQGVNNFRGYWRNTEKTAETFTEDGWLRTGDVGHLDADG